MYQPLIYDKSSAFGVLPRALLYSKCLAWVSAIWIRIPPTARQGQCEQICENKKLVVKLNVTRQRFFPTCNKIKFKQSAVVLQFDNFAAPVISHDTY